MGMFTDLNASIQNKCDSIKISCHQAITSVQEKILNSSRIIKNQIACASHVALSSIKLAVGYGLVGPVAGIVGFFGSKEEAIVMAFALTYGAITGITLANLLPFALLVGSTFGILSTLSLMQLNTHRFTLWKALSEFMLSAVSSLFGINLNTMIESNNDVFLPAIDAASIYVKNNICTTTPFARALTWGMTAANNVKSECYSADTIRAVARFGNYGL
jgi:hypothetical protein